MTQLLIFISEFDHYIAAIFVLLLVMSCLSWSMAIVLSLKALKLKFYAFKTQKMLQSTSTEQIEQLNMLSHNKILARSYGPFYAITQTGIRAHHAYSLQSKQGLSLSDYVASQLTMTSRQVLPKKGLTLLASTASSAPFIGLLGTVWGIYIALNVIGNQSNASLTLLAPAIAEALIITGVGLIVALPALLFYNFYARFYDSYQTKLNYFAQQWHNYLLTGIRPVSV